MTCWTLLIQTVGSRRLTHRWKTHGQAKTPGTPNYSPLLRLKEPSSPWMRTVIGLNIASFRLEQEESSQMRQLIHSDFEAISTLQKAVMGHNLAQSQRILALSVRSKLLQSFSQHFYLLFNGSS